MKGREKYFLSKQSDANLSGNSCAANRQIPEAGMMAGGFEAAGLQNRRLIGTGEPCSSPKSRGRISS